MEKSERIKNLQSKKDHADQKLQSYIAQNSANGYKQSKTFYEQYEKDKERYAEDLLKYRGEINELKNRLTHKNNEIENKAQELKNQKAHTENIFREKDSIIQILRNQIDDTEKKLSQMTRESLTGSTSLAVQRLQEELERIKCETLKKDQSILQTKVELEESRTKYSNFKKKVRAFQIHHKEQKEAWKNHLEDTNEYYRKKVESIKDKMIEVYHSRQKEVCMQFEAKLKLFIN